MSADRDRASRGYILLPVVVAIALVGAVAFLLHRATTLGLHGTAAQLERLQARYAAEAALRHATWFLGNDCTYRAAIVDHPFFGYTYGATLVDHPGGAADVYIETTGNLASGTSATLAFDYTCPVSLPNAIYWTDVGDEVLRRAELDGSGVTDLAGGGDVPIPAAVDVDAAGKRVYWVSDRTIRSATLVGSDVQIVMTCAACSLQALTVDPAGRKVYWYDDDQREIRRANLDGSAEELLVHVGIGKVTGLAVHPGEGKLYWVDEGNWTIKRADLDGTHVKTQSSGQYQPSSLALDDQGNRLYFFDLNTRAIWSTQLDASGSQQLVTMGVDEEAFDLDLDLDTGYLYWTTDDNGQIERAELDGSNREILQVYGAGHQMKGIAIGPGG